MTARAFSAFWDGGPLGPYEQLALASFAATGAAVAVHTYTDDLEVPAGVTVHDARAVVPEERMRSFPGGITHFSNHFRYRLLASTATVWFDTDPVLLDPTRLPASELVFSVQQDGLVNTALLGLPAGSPAAEELARRSDLPPETPLSWGALGPRLLTEVLTEHGLVGHALPGELVYPLGHDEIWRVFEDDPQGRCREAIAGAATLHLWNQYLKKLGLKDRAPAAGSVLADLADRAGVTFDLPPIRPGEARWASEAKFGRRNGRAARWWGLITRVLQGAQTQNAG